MAMSVAVGQAFSVEGREAVARAVYQARMSIGNAQVSFAFIIASIEYDFQAIFNAAQTQIGDVPMLGFSTTGEITQSGSHRRSVVVALVVDRTLECQTEWMPHLSGGAEALTRKMLQTLDVTPDKTGLLMVVADGLAEGYDELVSSLPPGRYRFAGCLAGGDIRLGHTYQLGGNKFGEGGLAAGFLSGKHLRVGVGTAHGWQPVGTGFQITAARGAWVRSLDDLPASEAYANLFGHTPREWAMPPLNTLVRLYPFGVQQENHPLTVRTPIQVEADGSLRMNTHFKKDDFVHLLVGSRDKCLASARQAAKDALQALEGAAPRLALVFTDLSWQMLFQGYEGAEIDAVCEVIGRRVPVAGGYTFGQFTHMHGAPRPEFLNQHIEVVLLGESA